MTKYDRAIALEILRKRTLKREIKEYIKLQNIYYENKKERTNANKKGRLLRT